MAASFSSTETSLPFISGASIPFSLTDNLYKGESLNGNLVAIVIVSASYTFITLPPVIGNVNSTVSSHLITVSDCVVVLVNKLHKYLKHLILYLYYLYFL